MSANDGGPAFARSFSYDEEPGLKPLREPAQEGMSLRDYFAKGAMESLIPEVSPTEPRAPRSDYEVPDIVATWAYRFADAMLRARETGATR